MEPPLRSISDPVGQASLGGYDAAMSFEKFRRRLGRAIRAMAVSAVSIVLLAVTPARSQEIIPLTAIDAYAPAALWVRVFLDYYIPEVDRRLAEAGPKSLDASSNRRGCETSAAE